MIKIGFDAKRAFQNKTGLGNYSRSLIHSLSVNFPENEYYLFTPSAKGDFKDELQLPNTILKTASLPILKSYWRRKLMTKELEANGIQLFHGLSHELPLGIEKTKAKSVVTIHDLIFMRYPEYYKKMDRKIYESKVRHACAHADKVIAISEQTKKDLQSFLKVSENKIEVLYQSCAPEFHKKFTPSQLKEISKKYKLPERFILTVGTIEKRKNLLLLIKAMQQLPPEIQLVVVGKPTRYIDAIHEFLLKNKMLDQVIFLDKVPFADLPQIYNLAELFVYPSKFEGFGIPVLEALTVGVPVLAAKGSCLEEAGGPESIYVDPEIAIDLSEEIIHLWNDEDQKTKMIGAGKQYALSFSPEILSKKLMDIYLQVL